MRASRASMLLFDAHYYGTLAAVRALGRDGIHVTVVDSTSSGLALWSRYAARRLRCPALAAGLMPFVAWLLRLGEREPGQVIYPTSDDVSYAFASHREDLAKNFKLYQPDLKTMMGLLDKGRLIEHALAVGIEAPETWLPDDEADVERIARIAGGRLMVKPRTQVLSKTHMKGILASGSAHQLRAAYRDFANRVGSGREILMRSPEVARPMIQRYHPEAEQRIHSLSGFCDRTGARFAIIGGTKVLQRPRRMGIGLCFEDAPVEAELATKVRRLCERIGYYGVFELEFVCVGNKRLLIDMNGRFYGQMAFDIARGMPLPQLAHAAAVGDDDEVARLVAMVPRQDAPRRRFAFCNGFGLGLMVGAQRLFGSMSEEEARGWRHWCLEHKDALVDAVADPDDRRPLAAEVVSQLFGHARHPRAFFRDIALNR
jgi:predicted ATP-grasp superfamily ATP-dependent carboligase